MQKAGVQSTVVLDRMIHLHFANAYIPKAYLPNVDCSFVSNCICTIADLNHFFQLCDIA